MGSFAAAGGALAAGGADGLKALGLGELAALRSAFLLYAVLGLACLLAYRLLPCLAPEARQAAHAPLGASRGIMLRLAALFSVDSFAGGLAVQALLAL